MHAHKLFLVSAAAAALYLLRDMEIHSDVDLLRPFVQLLQIMLLVVFSTATSCQPQAQGHLAGHSLRKTHFCS